MQERENAGQAGLEKNFNKKDLDVIDDILKEIKQLKN